MGFELMLLVDRTAGMLLPLLISYPHSVRVYTNNAAFIKVVAFPLSLTSLLSVHLVLNLAGCAEALTS